MTYDQITSLRSQLKRTWKYFFRPFGGRLYPVQIEAIPHILSGSNVIIQSPTASGKTEAVMAPVLERLLKSQFDAPAVFYTCPTRALVYDIYERMVHHVEDLGLSIAIRTGEIKQFKPSNPQDIILSTPESLDSMLCRNLKSISNIQYVILDELHLLHGTYRGDQLRMDILRLEEATEKKPQYCALSATFERPEKIASQYFNPYKVIKIKGTRAIDYNLKDYSKRKQSLSDLLQQFRQSKIYKALFFCNSRRETEELAQILKEIGIWPTENIYVHHGSLGKNERLSTEYALKTRRVGLCTATMTLEVGIDIGDIDMIVLVLPPPGVSSLLQRIGRGNRRENITRAIGLYKTEEDYIEFTNLFEQAIKGELDEVEHGPCFSVAVQQIFSLLYQNRNHGIYVEQLTRFLMKLPMKENHIRLLLQRLEEKEYIAAFQGKILATTKTIDLGDCGFIHANIPGVSAFQVVNDATGKIVGDISSFDQFNKEFVLSGKRWYIESIEGSRIKVSSTKSRKGRPPLFAPAQTHGRYFGLLPPQLKVDCCKEIDTTSSN